MFDLDLLLLVVAIAILVKWWALHQFIRWLMLRKSTRNDP
jgi:hypothetical protein